MEADQEIADRPDRLVYRLHLRRQGLALADQSEELQAKEWDRFARGAQDHPACDGHCQHEGVKRKMRRTGQQRLPNWRFRRDRRLAAAEARHQADDNQGQHSQSEHEMPGFQPLTYVGSLRSEEHTSELQSLMRISYAVFCLKKKT